MYNVSFIFTSSEGKEKYSLGMVCQLSTPPGSIKDYWITCGDKSTYFLADDVISYVDMATGEQSFILMTYCSYASKKEKEQYVKDLKAIGFIDYTYFDPFE